MIGKKIAHYEILELLGKGGMGEVYRARDSKLGRDVALKILPPDKAADPERLARFEREAKAVAALNHPNIVTIHSVEEADGHHFLTMEFVDGSTLYELIPSGGLALDKLFDIAIPLADALSAAHAKGITHRDLKPSNVMVDKGGRVKVLDFGLAKLFAPADGFGDDTVVHGDDPVTAEGKVLGTMNYMSPEQAESKEIDHRSDIFSLGVLLYEMSSGVRPFQGDTPISTISAILKDSPQPLTQRNTMLPRHLGRVVSRCLEKNPNKRYQTARDVCNELEGLQSEIASGEYQEQFSSSISRDDLIALQRKRANPWPWVAVAVVVLAVAGYFVLRPKGAAPRARELRATPLTSLAGVEDPGSWSPDGSFFAYSHSAQGPMDIFVASVAGGAPMRLVASEYDDSDPAWSPDNRWIAYVSGRSGTTSIYLIPPLGGESRLLADTGVQRLSAMSSAVLSSAPWSPDGKQILVSRSIDHGPLRVFRVDLASGEMTQITPDEPGIQHGLATYSHAGDRIAYVEIGDGTSSQIVVIPAEGGAPLRKLHVEARYSIPSWSPDDRRILYAPAEGGLWEFDVASGPTTRVTTGRTEEAPIVGKDGRVLYSTFSHQTDLYLQDVAGGTAKRLTFHTADNFGARISPDGRFVAYESSRTGNTELWLFDLNAGTERQLTQREGEDGNPRWTPDSQAIVFPATIDGEPGIWKLDVAAGVPQKVATLSRRSWNVRLSPDGKRIGYLVDGDSTATLMVMPANGGDASPRKDNVGGFEWYRDSDHVLYTPPGTRRELHAANLTTGEDVLLLEADQREFEVSDDGRLLSYVSSLSHYNMNLFVVDLDPQGGGHGLPRAIGAPRQVTHGDGEWHVHNGSISADGSRVVYTRDTDTGDVYLLEGVY